MQKQAPSIGRILIAVGFTLSCFGLILFLWIAFGGPIPLKPESYRITAYFPEATQLALESDVRIGGVSVGKVKEIELAPAEQRVNGKDTTEAEIEIEPEFAPISDRRAGDPAPEDAARRDLRRAHRGHRAGRARRRRSRSARRRTSPTPRPRPIESIPEGGTLGRRPDRGGDPDRRDLQRARRGDADLVPALAGERGGRDRRPRPRPQRRARQPRPVPHRRLATSLDDPRPPEGRRSRAWSATPGPSSRRSPSATRSSPGAIVGSDNTFDALASEDEALAETFQILPTFQRESRATLERLDEFQVDAEPLIQRPDPGRPRPLRRRCARCASCRRTCATSSSTSTTLERRLAQGPAGAARLPRRARAGARRARPVPRQPQPGDPLPRVPARRRSPTSSSARRSALSGDADEPFAGDPAPRHGLRQFSATSARETLAIWPSRLATNRGNGYLGRGALNGFTLGDERDLPQLRLQEHRLHASGAPARSQDPDEEEIRAGQSVAGVNNGNPPGAITPRFAALLHRRRLRERATTSRRPTPSAFGDGRFPDARSVGSVGLRPAERGSQRWLYFKDAQEVYDTIGRLFVELAADEELAPKFRKANTIVRYEYSDPESVITVRLQEGEPGDVDFGESEMEPEVTMTMEADTAHRFWLGQVNVTVALARGQIKATGPGREDPQARAADQAGLPPLQGPARGAGPRGPGRMSEAAAERLDASRFAEFYQFICTTRVIAGRGLDRPARDSSSSRRAPTAVLLVTDEVIRATGLAERVGAGVTDGGLELAGVFDGVPQDSDTGAWSRPARRPPRTPAPTRSSPSAAAR